MFVLPCIARVVLKTLRPGMLLVLLSAATAVGCSSIDLPADANLATTDTMEDEERLAKVRESALADPFPTAAEAGLETGSE